MRLTDECGVQNLRVLVVRYRRRPAPTILSLTRDREVVRVDRRVDLGLKRELAPQVARLQDAITPGRVAEVDELIERQSDQCRPEVSGHLRGVVVEFFLRRSFET